MACVSTNTTIPALHHRACFWIAYSVRLGVTLTRPRPALGLLRVRLDVCGRPGADGPDVL